MVSICVVVAVFLVRYGTAPADIDADAARSIWGLVLLYALIWVVLLSLIGEYGPRAHWTLRGEIGAIARATVWLALISVSLLFLFDLDGVSRLFLMVLFPVQGLATIVTRVVIRGLFTFLRRRGRNRRNLLILGTGERAEGFARQIERHSAFGLRIVGLIGDARARDATPWSYLGPVSAMPNVFRQHVVDEVAICLPEADRAQIRELVSLCLEEGKVVRIPLEEPHVQAGLRFVEDIDGVPVLSLGRGPDHVISLALKRAVDMIGAATGLLVLSPLLAGIALLILWRDGRPVLFHHTRIGVHGRPFTLVKFRTMVRDAEARFPEIATLSATRGPAFKMRDDPRVTRLGRFLRKTSLDEVPQLWNVLKGDMSLVGPRPAPPREVDGYDMWHRRRLSMKPGLTGLWQVSSRIDEDFDDRARLDLYYIDHWSLGLDLRIVARTLPVLLQAQGR